MSGTERKSASLDRLRELEQALASRDRELATLSELAARLHAEDDPQRIFDVVLDAVLEHMGLEAAWIFWGSDEDKRLHLAAGRGISQDYIDHIRRDGLEDCLCPEVFWTGHRMQARNTLQCPRMPTLIEGLTTPVAHACIPLRFEGLTRGVLNVAARPAETFSDRQLHFLETVGYQLCLAVERARHMQAERSRNREARALASITKAIGRSLDLSAVLRAVGETARDVLAVEQVLVLLGSHPAEMSVAYQSQPGHLELETGRRVDLVQRGFKLLRMVVTEHLSAAIDSAVEDPRVNPELTRRYGVGSCAAAPLLAGERVLGLLFFTNGHKRHWSEEQIVVVDGLAAQAAVAIENARLYADARQALGDLQRAQQRVLQQEKMATLGTFASGLAHEVRNPLNSMGLQLALLERRINRLDPALTRDLDNVMGILRQEIRAAGRPGGRLPALRAHGPHAVPRRAPRRPDRRGHPAAQARGRHQRRRARAQPRRRAAALHADGRREDAAGADQPDPQRHRGHAGGRHRERRERAGGGPGPHRRARHRARPAPGRWTSSSSSSRPSPRAPAWAWPSRSRSCCSTAATSPPAAGRARGPPSPSACRWAEAAQEER